MIEKGPAGSQDVGPSKTVRFVGRDLAALSRLTIAAEGRGWRVTKAEGPADVVIVDLDGHEGALEDLVAGAPRVLGYYSHVDEATGRAALAAGIEAYPRSRFWRELPVLLGP